MDRSSDLARLARAARSGDPAAVDAFVAAVQPEVVRSVRLVVGAGSSVAEEACQDALVDIVRGLPGLSSAQSAQAWAMRVAMRRAVRAARRQALRARFGGAGEEIELAADTRTSDRMLEIREAFGALPARLRVVAVLRLYLGLSVEETAEALQCSPGTVKSRLHAARRRLQGALGSEAGTAPPLTPTSTARKPT